MKEHDNQKWEQDMVDILNTWRQGLTWDQDTTTDSQESNPMPLTPKTEGKGKGRMNHNEEHEFKGFDGELQSSDHWINHMNNETAVSTDFESYDNHNNSNNNSNNGKFKQRNQQRNSDQLKRRPDPIDVKRSNSIAFRKSYDLYDLQSRQSPLSVSMSPKSSTIPNSAYSALVSPHYDSGYDGDAVHNNNIAPPLSATIKRTMNHMYDVQQSPSTNFRKQQIINSRSLPREFVQHQHYSKEEKYHTNHNVKYTNKDISNSPQDSRFSFGGDESNYRKRSNTYSYNNNYFRNN
jgi:hypothetical protein